MSWSAVHAALSDPRWDFRTIPGIASETGMSHNEVREQLEAHRSEIRQTISRDRQPVYTIRSRPMKMREVVADLRLYASKSL